MKITAVCAWGYASDVLLDIKESVLLLSDITGTDKTKHGFCNHVQLDLTATQAKQLAGKLLSAAMRADELEAGWQEYGRAAK
jgi:hypothetical protein